MKIRLFYSVIILLILGILISQLKVIPSWNKIQTVLLVSVFIGALVPGLLYIFKLWKTNYKKHKKIIKTVLLVVIFPISFFFAMPLPSIFQPEYIKTIKQDDNRYYIYNESCFPPDSDCECDTYGSILYIKNKYLPIMHLVLKANFYVESVQLNHGEFILKASDICSKDLGKIKRIKQ